MVTWKSSTMKKMSETIIFFGSGPVAAASLQLLSKSFAIEAVITKPRPDHHKGTVPVLDIAAKLNLPVFAVTDKQTLEHLFEARPVKSKVAVLIDFGIIAPQSVIDYFPLGIVNSHFSLLPEWRGADPITFAILSGQEITGVSLMLLVAAMDEGPLLGQGVCPIAPEATTLSLTDNLIDLSYQMLVEILPEYVAGSVTPYLQDDSHPATYSRKLTKEDSIVDWSKPAEQIEREVRAFAGWPKTRTTFGDLEIIITKAHVIDASNSNGKTAVIDKKPVVYCGDKALALDTLKPAGKKEMTGEAFLAGYKSVFLDASGS
jgi:methionyl-tRNA formyltransferase